MAHNNPATRRIYDKQYRKDHPELYTRIRRSKQIATKQHVRTFKDKPCADCKRSYPFFVMDFDHRPGTDKKFKIAAWLARNAAKRDWTEVEAEIAKCDVVCANCHRIRTHTRLLGTIGAKKGALEIASTL